MALNKAYLLAHLSQGPLQKQWSSGKAFFKQATSVTDEKRPGERKFYLLEILHFSCFLIPYGKQTRKSEAFCKMEAFSG